MENANYVDTTEVVETTEGTEDLQAKFDELQDKYNKTEENFRKMAKRYNSLKSQTGEEAVDVNALVEQKVGELNFYNSDPVAKEFKSEIQAIQSKYSGMNPQEAFTLWKAQNKPELLSKKSNEWVDGVDNPWKWEITDQDLMSMSDEEFMKNFRP